MHIEKSKAVQTLMDFEKMEKEFGRFKAAGSFKNIVKFRQLKKELEPATYGVISVEVNERDFLSLCSRISKLSKKR